MCDQRERLLGYVYDEGDAKERAEVQAHLDQCPDCRAEVAGLRSVRTDLLAWEVPAHSPVWRPFAVAPPVPWWRQVPAWAMAAAAGMMLLLGATGSVVAQAVMPARTIAAGTTDGGGAVTPVVTAADVSAAQARLAAQFRQQIGEVDARVNRVSDRAVSVRAVEGDHNAMVTELFQMQSDYRAQLAIIKSLKLDFEKFTNMVNANQADMAQKITNLTALVNAQVSAK